MFFVSKSNWYRQYVDFLCFYLQNNVLFKVLTKSKILERLDLSDDFRERFNVQDKLKKQTGWSIWNRNIDNPNLVTIAINPKEYFEKYKDYSINKKHKGIKKNTPGMNFETYSERLATLHEFCSSEKIKELRKNDFKLLKETRNSSKTWPLDFEKKW